MLITNKPHKSYNICLKLFSCQAETTKLPLNEILYFTIFLIDIQVNKTTKIPQNTYIKLVHSYMNFNTYAHNIKTTKPHLSQLAQISKKSHLISKATQLPSNDVIWFILEISSWLKLNKTTKIPLNTFINQVRSYINLNCSEKIVKTTKPDTS